MQETKHYFTALCSGKAEPALPQACQSSAPNTLTSAIKAELGALQLAGPDCNNPADISMQAASPTPVGAAPEQDQQEGLSQVQARLQNILQQLTGQPEVAQAVAQPAPQQGPRQDPAMESVTPVSGQDLKAVANPDTRQEGQREALERQAGQDTAGEKSSAALSQDQQAADAQSPAASSTPEMSPEQQEPLGAAAGSSAVEVMATAVAKAATSPPVPSSVSVVCGDLAGTFDAARTMVQLESGQDCRPSTFEKRAGKGTGKTWSKTVKVDHCNALLAMPIGKWLKSYKRAVSNKGPSLKRKQAAAQHAKHGPGSAVISADGTVKAADPVPAQPQSPDARRTRSPSKHVCTSAFAIHA